nr:hypothetical protein [Mangrovicoccus ximenensis]
MLTLTDPIEMQRPPVLRFGDGTLEGLAAWAEAQGCRRPFVVADPVNAARLGALGAAAPCPAGPRAPPPGG